MLFIKLCQQNNKYLLFVLYAARFHERAWISAVYTDFQRLAVLSPDSQQYLNIDIFEYFRRRPASFSKAVQGGFIGFFNVLYVC